MRRIALAALLLVTACSIGMRQPAHAHPFCEGGHVVLPGQYVGQVMIQVRQDLSILRPLLAGDTLCMRRPPKPPPQMPPEFSDSAKP